MENEISVTPSRPRIGGWLILPAIGVAGSIILDAFSVGSNIPLLGKTVDSVQHLVAAEIVMAAALFAVDIVAALAFFQRKTSAPKLMEIWLYARLVVTIVDYVWLQGVFSGPQAQAAMTVAAQSAIRTLIATVFWVSYFRRSVRVQQTFNPEAENPAGAVV